MTSAGAAIVAELRKIQSAGDDSGLADGRMCKDVIGTEPFNDAEMQEFIMAGFEFANRGDFKAKMAVAAAWVYLGYKAAQNEVKQ
jgi:hypothetical protein